jgi:hypothetical protein
MRVSEHEMAKRGVRIGCTSAVGEAFSPAVEETLDEVEDALETLLCRLVLEDLCVL